jgi:hypothetical protein
MALEPYTQPVGLFGRIIGILNTEIIHGSLGRYSSLADLSHGVS